MITGNQVEDATQEALPLPPGDGLGQGPAGGARRSCGSCGACARRRGAVAELVIRPDGTIACDWTGTPIRRHPAPDSACSCSDGQPTAIEMVR